MIILAVDDEELGLNALVRAIGKAEPKAQIVQLSKPGDALDYIKENAVDVAFLDISMAGMLGTELGRQIKLISPQTYIIFATGYDSYMGDAFSLHANGYLLKPITVEKVRSELDNLDILRKNIAVPEKDGRKRVRFQCFGNFEAFVDGKPVLFKYDRTKEILAYMVSRRGALCSNKEIESNVWDDDDNHDSYFRGLKKDLVDTLTALNAQTVIISQKGKTGIDLQQISCDYYDFLDGSPDAINLYRGEFMSQYSWGELTNAELQLGRL